MAKTGAPRRQEAGDRPSGNSDPARCLSATWAACFLILIWASALGTDPLLALDPEKTFHQYQLDVWQAAEGLPQGSVAKILQTSDGYLWLGGYEDLVRFDGASFTVVASANTPEIRGNNIYALAEGPDGSLWIGTDGGGVTRYKDGSFTTYTNRDGLAHDQVTALLVGRDDSLWIGTFGGLSRLKDGRFVTFTARDGLPHELVWALAEDRYDNLWIGTEGGLARLAGDGLTNYTAEHGLVDQGISALSEDRQGNLWIGTAGGTLLRFAGGPEAIERTPDILQGYSGHYVADIHEDRDGNLWIASQGGGLSRLRDGELTSHGPSDGLTSDVVWTLFEDREGSLWIGTEGGGLNRLRDTRFTPITTRDGLPHDRVWVVEVDPRGNSWIGTDGGGLAKLDNGKVATYTTNEGLASDNVTALHSGLEGDLWIGTDRGLQRLRQERISGHLAPEVGASTVVLAICHDRQGDLWVGTETAGLHRIRDAGGPRPAARGPALTTYSTANGLPHNTVRALVEDAAGALWIGTDGGLAKLAGDELTTYPEVAFVRSIHEDQQGTMWIATRGRGLTRIRGAELKTFTTRDGLYTDAIYHLLEDDQQNLWMSSNKGIFRVNKGELDDHARGAIPSLRSAVYGTADGMRSIECGGGSQPAGARATDGKLWFPTLQGLVVIDPENLRVNRLPPPVHIERISSGGVPVDSLAIGTAGIPSLPPEVRDLDFYYTALSLLDPKAVRFKYRLEGYDRAWVDAGTRRFAHYTNMAPGSYRFRVIAANNDGVWNEAGDSFELYLRPAFFQTRYFQGLCVVAFALLGLAIHRLLVRRLLNNLRELRRTRTELENKNDEVEARNAEMERFTYTVSHDLKSPLLTIQGFAGLLGKDLVAGKNQRVKRDLERIGAAVTKMNELLNNLLELSRIGRAVNPPQEIPVSELVHQALEMVAGRIAERGAEVAVSADLGIAFGDAPRLVEVFQNLIDNAVKYMGDQPQPRIEIGLRRDTDEPVIYVRDNGIGIDPKYHAEVFQLFDQLNPKVEGTGIGLALVKRIVEVHGGRIWIESAGPGKGSTFALVLPAKGVD